MGGGTGSPSGSDTTIYFQGLFSDYWDVERLFTDKISELCKKKLCSLEVEEWDNVPVKREKNEPNMQYFLGSLRVSGTQESVEEIENKIKEEIKELGIIELERREYKELKSSRFDREFLDEGLAQIYGSKYVRDFKRLKL